MSKYKLSTQPYKGTKDYYPQDMFKRDYLFNIWRKTAKEFGYEEYDTPILEDANIYRAKSGDELANTQLYNFVDKGGREVAIRPEMTPSVARLIAGKINEYPKPIRWFSIDKFYRYEKPQRGRTREFFQLNFDIFGISDMSAELEVFSYINAVMEKLGAPQNTWKVYINNRYLMDYFFDTVLKLNSDLKSTLARAIDNYLKLTPEDFKDYLKEIGLDPIQIEKVVRFVQMDESGLEDYKECRGGKELIDLLTLCKSIGLNNFVFKPYIMRGISYYTGTVIEMFDTGSDKNPRALFGGGRYDDLLDIFDKPKLPAFGMGWGNVTMEDFLTTYDLYPQYKSSTNVILCLNSKNDLGNNMNIANDLRKLGINCEMILEDQDLRKQLNYCSKKEVPYVILQKDGAYILKNMNTREQDTFKSIKDLVNGLTQRM